LHKLKQQTYYQDGPYEDELDEVPHYLRERVAFLIDQKVEKRVQEHMALLREEVHRDLNEQID
jgi:hypothetical protein